MMWYDDGPGWGGWLVMTVGMLAFWTLVAIAVVAIVRSVRDDRGADRSSGPDPRRLLDERFARGKIDPEDYEAIRSRTSTTSGAPSRRTE